MTGKKADFSAKEARRRFEAALRGSRVIGPYPPKIVTPLTDCNLKKSL
jgi:hypothetical protein